MTFFSVIFDSQWTKSIDAKSWLFNVGFGSEGSEHSGPCSYFVRVASLYVTVGKLLNFHMPKLPVVYPENEGNDTLLMGFWGG